MYTKREVIQVRYRNSNGTLSRPHKLQKLTFTNNTEYHTMNMSSKKTGAIEHSKKVTNSKRIEKIITWNSIDPETFTTTWENKKQNKKPKGKKNTIEIIRVRFKNTRKKGNKLGRPTKIKKITYTSDKVVYYSTNYLNTEYKENSFITKWESDNGTPTSKASHKYNDEQLKERGFSQERINEIHKNNWKNSHSSKTLSKIWKKHRNSDGIRIPRQEVAKLLSNGTIKAEDFYKSNEEKKEARKQHNTPAILRKRKSERKKTRTKKKQSKSKKKLARRGQTRGNR